MSKEGKQVFGLIEFDPTRNVFVGRIVGFPHIEFEAKAFGDVERRLRESVLAMIESDSLVMETEFCALVHLAGGARDVADLPASNG
ncbi:hypothetical protein QWJ38_23250 [Pelomonas sp. PFR6]|uniref:HicB-like antitoxin of toxin-antitoxin system domain-containing protein n=1 Tax=Roseateles violae TaxID=3058042 RepID=A0ABT8E084_9BURK|nr:hypothetical protein [Pelomonas sp. PFR6]